MRLQRASTFPQKGNTSGGERQEIGLVEPRDLASLWRGGCDILTGLTTGAVRPEGIPDYRVLRTVRVRTKTDCTALSRSGGSCKRVGGLSY